MQADSVPGKNALPDLQIMASHCVSMWGERERERDWERKKKKKEEEEGGGGEEEEEEGWRERAF